MSGDQVGIYLTFLGVVVTAVLTFIRSGKTDRNADERAEVETDAARLKEALARIDKLEADVLAGDRRFRILEDYTRLCRGGLETARIPVPEWPEGLK